MQKGKNEVWFTEALELDKGRALTLRVKKVLESFNSQFQEIAVYETECFGKMLALDGVIQLTESDEFCYQEMISHPALCVHPNPQKVLVIGGGDGGVVREAVKHPSVEQVDLVEIDPKVVEVSKKYLPGLSCELDNPKIKVIFEDGSKFVKLNNGYDVVIVDSSDPIGPAVALFRGEFYQDIFNCLNEGGILVTQCESMFYHKDIIKDVIGKMKGIFPIVTYYCTMIPTYPSGNIGFSFASKRYKPSDFRDERFDLIKGKTRYYNPLIHSSAFALPEFMKEIVG